MSMSTPALGLPMKVARIWSNRSLIVGLTAARAAEAATQTRTIVTRADVAILLAFARLKVEDMTRFPGDGSRPDAEAQA